MHICKGRLARIRVNKCRPAVGLAAGNELKFHPERRRVFEQAIQLSAQPLRMEINWPVPIYKALLSCMHAMLTLDTRLSMVFSR